MALQTVLETALFQRVITPEMKDSIQTSLWSQDLNEQEMNCIQLLMAQLQAGEICVIQA